MTARPIFVLGMQRSGTTWAANLLAAHPEIAAVTAEDHHGVHESVFFSHFARAFGSWESPSCRARFEEAFRASDYGLLSFGAPAAATCPTAADFFRGVMERVADAGKAQAWVEKSPHHTLLAPDLAKMFPDAVFLCITREPKDLLRSRLWSYGRTPPAYPKRAVTIVRSIASSVFHNRFLADFAARNDQAVLVRFEDLTAGGPSQLVPLLELAGVETAHSLRSEFEANSSFQSGDARQKALTNMDRAIARVVASLAGMVPQPLLGVLQRRIAARRPLSFPGWVWKRNGGPPFEIAMDEQ